MKKFRFSDFKILKFYYFIFVIILLHVACDFYSDKIFPLNGFLYSFPVYSIHRLTFLAQAMINKLEFYFMLTVPAPSFAWT